jgi:hypothetical protein
VVSLGTRASNGDEGEKREKNMAGMGRHGHVFACSLSLPRVSMQHLGLEGARGQGRIALV